MTLSLSEISTPGASFAEDVEAYAAAGFDAIGIWEFKLPPDDEANLALLAEHDLAVSVCVPEVPSVLPLAIAGMEGPSDVAVRIAALEASVRRLAAYNPECVACLAGPLGDNTLAEGTDLLVGALQRLGGVAREARTWVGFEPVHRTQREEAGFVNSLNDDSWGEKTINGTNAPKIGAQLASSGPVVTGSYVTITLPNSVVTGNNDLNLALTPNSATALALSSREDPTNPPHLLVTTS